MLRALPIACTCALAACGGDGGGPVLSHEFPVVRAGVGEELTTTCLSWRLGNDEPLLVHEVAMAAGPGWHHSNWMFVPEGQYPVDDGAWDCAGEFDEVSAALSGGVLFAQSTQATGETQSFGDGAALEIPSRSVIVSQVHIINASDAPLDATVELTLTTLAEDEVSVRLRPLALDFHQLALPPGQRSRFQADCDLMDRYAAPLDFSIHYLLPHYHGLGRGMEVETYGGTRDGETLFSRRAQIGEPLGETMVPPRPVSGAQGIRFSCEFDNTTDATVGFGNSVDGEMCVLLAFTDAPVFWAGGVLEGAPVSLGADEDGAEVFEGACDVYWVAR
jgi:hypothetical protein